MFTILAGEDFPPGSGDTGMPQGCDADRAGVSGKPLGCRALGTPGLQPSGSRPVSRAGAGECGVLFPGMPFWPQCGIDGSYAQVREAGECRDAVVDRVGRRHVSP